MESPGKVSKGSVQQRQLYEELLQPAAIKTPRKKTPVLILLPLQRNTQQKKGSIFCADVGIFYLSHPANSLFPFITCLVLPFRQTHRVSDLA